VPDLDARYGRTPQRRRRRLWFAVAAALAFIAVFAAWVVWAGFDGNDHVLEAQDIGYQKVGDDQVTVRWELTADPGTEVRCALKALDERYEVVGWKVIDIPASDQLTRPFSHTLRIVSPATTGLISGCWLP
jgi:type VI protein secretion system component VasK